MADFYSMQIIQAWLDGARDYEKGILLYKQFGTNELLKKMFFNEAATKFKKQKLLDVMKELAGIAKPAIKPPGVAIAIKEEAPVIVKGWKREDNKDATEQALWEKYVATLKEKDFLRHKLLDIKTDEERKEAAFKILKLDREATQLKEDHVYYRTHGHLPQIPDKPAEFENDPVRIGTRMESLKKYIRRENQHIKNNPGKVDAVQRKKAWIEELNYYLTQLNKPLYADRPEESATTGPDTAE